ncbi:hypothetical protein RRG08_011253 [Elysia crispata]|uniref:Uncharacterized protein n=1 Tax=Elysia crispata TaxID=231223 RepID=A0AAE0YNG5_9GAST|nr:hypothetical protein RRG08_011253 [Elysia crispata]
MIIDSENYVCGSERRPKLQYQIDIKQNIEPISILLIQTSRQILGTVRSQNVSVKPYDVYLEVRCIVYRYATESPVRKVLKQRVSLGKIAIDLDLKKNRVFHRKLCSRSLLSVEHCRTLDNWVRQHTWLNITSARTCFCQSQKPQSLSGTPEQTILWAEPLGRLLREHDFFQADTLPSRTENCTEFVSHKSLDDKTKRRGQQLLPSTIQRCNSPGEDPCCSSVPEPNLTKRRPSFCGLAS